MVNISKVYLRDNGIILREFRKFSAPKTRSYSPSIVLKTNQLHPKELSSPYSSLYSKNFCPTGQVSSAAPATFLLTLSLCLRLGWGGILLGNRAGIGSLSPSSRWWEKREQTWLWSFLLPLSSLARFYRKGGGEENVLLLTPSQQRGGKCSEWDFHCRNCAVG